MPPSQILEEGKAFELGESFLVFLHIGFLLLLPLTDIAPLAGNRWHIDCFRCSTCGTLLDSDAHLLLLGDGSLICSNCTYSCSSCGNKIEDLAILTGDQAYCSNCFRCRNCKRKIENLRYARTSQGIFCMDCHETLMQRRKKKKAAGSANSGNTKKQSPSLMKLDKSLPSLPPNATSSNEASGDRNESNGPTVEPSDPTVPNSKLQNNQTKDQGN